MPEISWACRITVGEHAALRAQERLGWADAALIRSEVRDALLHGRVAEVQPNWTRARNVPGTNRGLHRYLYDRETTRCWLVLPNLDGTALLVQTLLLHRDEYVDESEQRHVRSGHVRR